MIQLKIEIRDVVDEESPNGAIEVELFDREVGKVTQEERDYKSTYVSIIQAEMEKAQKYETL